MSDCIVATYPGTGTDSVRRVLQEQNHTLVEITGRKAAHTATFDKLILLGGADIAPFWYGETPTYTGSMNQERDIVEWTLIRRAYDGAQADHGHLPGTSNDHRRPRRQSVSGHLHADDIAATGTT